MEKIRMNVKVKKLNDKAKVPTRATELSAGYDLYACFPDEWGERLVIQPNETIKINTGLSMELPSGYFGGIFARSGLAIKQGLRPANCVGVVDSDYRGEYIVALHNDSDYEQMIYDGDRIAQLILLPYQIMEFEEVDSLEETDRGKGGFGSTGR